MIAGMTIANLFGVPLGTALSASISWRLTFLLVGCWGVIILYYMWRWVPRVENLPDTGLRGSSVFEISGTLVDSGGHRCWVMGEPLLGIAT